MNERERKILDAAKGAFSRYGVKRTSMGDLAEAAGVSRQTLYNAFKNKEDILIAWIRDYADEGVATIEGEIEKGSSLDDLLDAMFAKIAVESYDLISNSPNAEELVEGFNAASMEEWDAVAARFRAAMVLAFTPYKEALAQRGMDPDSFAGLVFLTTKAAKSNAGSRTELLQRLDTLKKVCLSVTGAS